MIETRLCYIRSGVGDPLLKQHIYARHFQIRYIVSLSTPVSILGSVHTLPVCGEVWRSVQAQAFGGCSDTGKSSTSLGKTAVVRVQSAPAGAFLLSVCHDSRIHVPNLST